MNEVKSGNIFLQQFMFYAIIIIVLIMIIYGVQKVYSGVKKKQKWAKITATLLIVLLIFLIIGGIIFYIYALALGEAFSTGL